MILKLRAMTLVLLVAATTAKAVILLPFTSWEDLARNSPDIVITSCTAAPDPNLVEDGIVSSIHDVTSVLKGGTKPGAARLASQYSARQGERLLIFATWQSNQLYQGYNAMETYRVVPLGRYFLTSGLEGKPLHQQIRLVLQSRLEDVSRELERSAEEKKRLEAGLNTFSRTGIINSFDIYLAAEPVDRGLTARGNGDWSRIRLSESPLISATDIISYDFANHVLRLRPEALARIPRPPVWGTPFVVVANGQPIYLGVFTTCLSSMSFAVPSIMTDRRVLVTNQAPDILVIEWAYPQPSFGVGPDPRGDQRIKTALTALHKLKNDAALGSSALWEVVSADTPLKELLAQSPIIVYATADTNHLPDIRFVIAEIWKGSNEASTAGITVGTKLSLLWPSDGGPLPEGAVLFYQRSVPPSEAFQIRSEYMVRAGGVGGTTIQEFKTAFGLSKVQEEKELSYPLPPRDREILMKRLARMEKGMTVKEAEVALQPMRGFPQPVRDIPGNNSFTQELGDGWSLRLNFANPADGGLLVSAKLKPPVQRQHTPEKTK